MGRRECRGGAVVELALVAPLLVALFWLGVWLTELVKARLGAQEAARALAWEWAGSFPEGWEEKRSAAAARARRRLEGLVGFAGASAELRREAVPLRFPSPPPVRGHGVWSGWIRSVLARGTGSLLSRWGLGRSGQLEGTVQVTLKNPYPVPWREVGLDALSEAEIEARAVLWGDDWHLDDGGDVNAAWRGGGPRQETTALYRQVKRLTYLGSPEVLAGAQGRLKTLPLLSRALPSLFGTFVVSRAYRKQDAGEGPSRCEGIPGYREAATTESGLRDFMEPGRAWLDHPIPQCFDSSPFRDVHAYPRGEASSGNLSMQIFRKRGPYFMGCLRPMAQRPVDCEAP